ncbi:MAG: hypothetical protein JW801_07005 [Bacteroidales bacterium]|nr:hypothetical protein [Bacteroidales bacterium]
MKSIFLSIAVFSLLLLSGCDYFKNHKLFSKDDDDDEVVDMRTDKQDDLSDSAAIAYTDEAEEYDVASDNANGSAGAYPEKSVSRKKSAQQDFAPSGSDKYFMIVGSFLNQNLANRYAETIGQKGYSTSVLGCPDGYFRVSAKSYSNFKLGVSEINDFRSSLVASAWLYVRK